MILSAHENNIQMRPALSTSSSYANFSKHSACLPSKNLETKWPHLESDRLVHRVHSPDHPRGQRLALPGVAEVPREDESPGVHVPLPGQLRAQTLPGEDQGLVEVGDAETHQKGVHHSKAVLQQTSQVNLTAPPRSLIIISLSKQSISEIMNVRKDLP